MALIKSVRGFTPEIGDNCYLADNATIIGDVVMGNDCSIWFGTVLRGDVNSIKIGDCVNIQDGSVLHTLYQKSTIEIGDLGRPQRHHPWCKGARLCPHRHGKRTARRCRDRRRSHHRRWQCGDSPHQGRTLRTLGWRTCQVHQDGIARTGERDQPEDCPQLQDVCIVV